VKTKGDEGFRICGGKGFHVTFENGWTVSVQFGGGNYCSNYDEPIGASNTGEKGSFDAEVAAWPKSGQMHRFPDQNDTVIARQSPAQVLAILNWAAVQT
jgi:hypothetical protein